MTGRRSPLTLGTPLEAARAELKRAEALLADARLALSRTRVTAPFDGHVREESVDVGQIVGAGQTVGRLFASAAVEVVVPLSDTEAALIPGLWELKAGDGEQGVQALVAARYGEGKYAWKGYVDRGETSVDELTRTIDVVVRVPDPFSAGIPVGHPLLPALVALLAGGSWRWRSRDLRRRVISGPRAPPCSPATKSGS